MFTSFDKLNSGAVQLQACDNAGCIYVMKRTVQQCHVCKTATRKTAFSAAKLYVTVEPTTSRAGQRVVPARQLLGAPTH